MKKDIKENSIVVLKDANKTSFLEQIRRDKGLFNVKVLGVNELKKKYLFDYTKKTIYYVSKKCNTIPEIAKIYIENLYFIDDDVYSDAKLKFLKDLKSELFEQGLLIENKEFKSYLNNKDIVLYKLSDADKFYDKIFAELEKNNNVIRIEEEISEFEKKPLYKLPKKELEVAFVASRVAKLLKSGVDINKILLANVQEDYYFTLKNTFKDFNIPLELDLKDSLNSTKLIKEFKNNYASNIEETLDKVKLLVKTDRDKYIFEKLTSILNEYYWCEDYLDVKDLVFEDIASIKVPSVKYKSAVRVINFMDEDVDHDDYVFLLNFNQGVIPVDAKEEDYLNDEIKRKLGASDSVDLNKKAKKAIQDKIKSIKNLTVTYSARDLKGELYISRCYDENLFESYTSEMSFEDSHAFNKKMLLIARDEKQKYGTKTDVYNSLNGTYIDTGYKTFDNSYKGINKDSFWKYMNDELTLSYSSMNAYYECGFRYFLSNILKMEKFEDTFDTYVGNVYHYVLSKAFQNDFDFESSWNKAIEKETYELSISEKFFIEILKEELITIISTIKDIMKNTMLDHALFEEKIVVKIDEEKNINFKGFVDKILYGSFGEELIAVIIDYKTGTPTLNIDNVEFGLGLQLPVYAYLLKNHETLKNAKIGGFYLEKILNNIKDPDKKREALKLQGYSNDDVSILNKVDTTYKNSDMIKSLKKTSNGFYAYSKVLSNEKIEGLISLTEKKILEAKDDIKALKFDINPKEVDNKLVGCAFCKFKNICFMKNEDIKKLERNKEDSKGGDIHA